MTITALTLSVLVDPDTMEWEIMDMDTALTPDPTASLVTTDHSDSGLEATAEADTVTADKVDFLASHSISCASSVPVLGSR
jgi:hypothetical protein